MFVYISSARSLYSDVTYFLCKYKFTYDCRTSVISENVIDISEEKIDA